MSVPSSEQQVLIEATDLHFQYRDAPKLSVEQVNLRVHAGDRILVIGHNGCGKSTLLSLLAGRRKPKSGSVRVLSGQHDPFDETSMAQHIALIGAPWPSEAYFANTVDRVAAPAPVPERKAAIAKALHLRLSRYVDKMSSGEKRRVQILHGMLYPATIFLLDECSTDIDVAERRTVLDLVKSECETRRGCCLYATHILDKVHDWATHLLLMEAGKATRFIAVKDITVPLETYAFTFMAHTKGHFELSRTGVRTFAIQGTEAQDVNPTTATPTSYYPNASAAAAGRPDVTDAVITCEHLTYKDIFRDMSFTVYRAERVLLAGCNGAGKSTLLNMLGGKQFFPNHNRAVQVFGKACYDDMTLNGLISYGGDWWVKVPDGEMHVYQMLTLDTARGHKLAELLAVDLQWDVRHISSGEQKRVQLLLFLLEDRPLVLLDEATADLDVDQRHQLLSFLYEESVRRGVTVVYSTHIFGGLEGWASTLIILDRTCRGVHAVNRPENWTPIDLDALTQELIALKAREEF